MKKPISNSINPFSFLGFFMLFVLFSIKVLSQDNPETIQNQVQLESKDENPGTEKNADKEAEGTNKSKFNISKCYVNDYDCIIARQTELLSHSKNLLFSSENNYKLRAIAYYKKGKFELALRDFERIREQCRANVYLGNIYLMKARFNEAYGIFSIVIKETPRDAEAYLGRGIVLNHLGNFQLALEDFEHALFIAPLLSKAYYNRGVNYMKIAAQLREYEYGESVIEKVYKKAIKDFDMVEELDVNDTKPELYLKRSKVYEALGQKEKAKIDRVKFEEKEIK